MLGQTSGIDEVGQIQWQLLLILILSWILVYLCIFKGVKSTGKVNIRRESKREYVTERERVTMYKYTYYLKTKQSNLFFLQVIYFTVLFPYVVLIALMVNNAMLPGALDGITFFIVPKWEKLLEFEVKKNMKRRNIPP